MKVNRMSLTVIGKSSEPRPMTSPEQISLLSGLRGNIIPWKASTRPKLEGVELVSWKSEVRTATTADLFSFASRLMAPLGAYLKEAYEVASEEERQKLQARQLFEVRDDSMVPPLAQLTSAAMRFVRGKWFSAIEDLPSPLERISVKHLANLNHEEPDSLKERGYSSRKWSIPMPSNMASGEVYNALDRVTASVPDAAVCPMVTRFALCNGNEKLPREVWVPIVRAVKSRNGLVVYRDIVMS